MAKAAGQTREPNLKSSTDCMYFMNGHCKFEENCRFRHCTAAAAQTNNCFKWPKTCRNVKCLYRHPAPPSTKSEEKKRSTSEAPTATSSPPAKAPAPPDGLISFFWDIENVPIPKGQKPFDIVQRIRQKLVVETSAREYNFTCYCNSTTISQENQLNLFHANVRIVHVPDRKSGAVDRQIMLELDRFERAHRPPATIVLISGDIDFVGKLSDLRHQAGFHVIVIHNKPAKAELKATVNAHYPWEMFAQTSRGSPPAPAAAAAASANSLDSLLKDLTKRTPQPYRMSTPKTGGDLRRVDHSPARSTTSARGHSAASRKPTHRCPKCTNEFDSVQALRQHQEAKDHFFDCPACHEQFSTPEGQTQHQKAKGHYEPQFRCRLCQRQFPKLESLVQHQQATGHIDSATSAASKTQRPVEVRSSSSTVPKNTHPNRNDLLRDQTTLIIQQGIDVLVEHLPKLFSAKK